MAWSPPLQGPDDLAYVIYLWLHRVAKGVMISHRGAVNTVLDINPRFGVGAQDRGLALSALSSSVGHDIFGILAAGARL